MLQTFRYPIQLSDLVMRMLPTSIFIRTTRRPLTLNSGLGIQFAGHDSTTSTEKAEPTRWSANRLVPPLFPGYFQGHFNILAVQETSALTHLSVHGDRDQRASPNGSQKLRPPAADSPRVTPQVPQLLFWNRTIQYFPPFVNSVSFCFKNQSIPTSSLPVPILSNIRVRSAPIRGQFSLFHNSGRVTTLLSQVPITPTLLLCGPLRLCASASFAFPLPASSARRPPAGRASRERKVLRDTGERGSRGAIEAQLAGPLRLRRKRPITQQTVWQYDNSLLECDL